MSSAALQRQAALAGAALLAALLVVVLDRSSAQETSAASPTAAGSRAEWESATVGIFGRSRLGETTAMRHAADAGILGIAHPVLPCGVDLVVSRSRA